MKEVYLEFVKDKKDEDKQRMQGNVLKCRGRYEGKA